MSGPAWTRTPRWGPARSPAAVEEQEAPYLSHLTSHHSRFTLTAPNNMGRMRQSEENVLQPTEEENNAVQSKKVKKRKKKKGLDPQIVTAVINAGISPGNGPRSSSPSSSNYVSADSEPLRPASASSILPRPVMMSRDWSGTSGGMNSRGEIIATEGQSRALGTPARAYNRTDVWTGLDLPEEGPPAFSIPLISVPLLPTMSGIRVPSSPPPEYPFPISTDPSHLSLDSVTATESPELNSEVEEENEDASDFIFNEADPLVIAWEEDRAAGLPLDERITRDLDRRLRAEAASLPTTSATTLEMDTVVENDGENVVDIPDAERERMRFERREIEMAERERDVPRVARALSIYAGRRFAAAAERRQAAAKRRTTINQGLAIEPTLIPIRSIPTTSAEAEEESESSGEESTPAQKVHGNQRFAEAAERRMAVQRMNSIPTLEEQQIHSTQPKSIDPPETPTTSSTFSLLFPPKPFGTATHRIPSPSASSSAPSLITITSPIESPSIESTTNGESTIQVEMICPPSPRPRSSPQPSQADISPPLSAARVIEPRSSNDHLGNAINNSRQVPVHPQYGPRPLEIPRDLPWSSHSSNSILTPSPEPFLSTQQPSNRPPIPTSRPLSRSSPISTNRASPSRARRYFQTSPSTTPANPNPSILSTIPSGERERLVEPIIPTKAPIGEGDQFAAVRNLMARFEGSTNRRRPPPPPSLSTSYQSNRSTASSSRPVPQRRNTPIADRFTSENYNGAAEGWGGVVMSKPLPTPPVTSEPIRVDAFTALRLGVDPAESLRNRENLDGGVRASRTRFESSHSVELLREVEESVGRRPTLRGRNSSTSSSFFDTPPVSNGVAEVAEEFAYTDLDILLARLEDRTDPNYDELLVLAEVMGPARPVASSEEEIETLGAAKVEVERTRIDKQGRTKTKLSVVGLRCGECSICMSRFRAEEYAVVLPRCLHIFHAECISRCLRGSRLCPLCRAEVFEPKIID